ncbi:hypothetical protein GY45DRAFT_1435254 [Cubamyces sp. BRFM 1775]|nr:hypothetical protein GY45DRAFT_1435254 [Cubamyces sp. BRFM 1775]
MSSLAGPSSHAFSSFSVHTQQPTAISTKLRRVTDADSTPSSATTPPTTVPPTPVVRAQSVAETDGREQSQDRQVNGNASHEQDGTIYALKRRPQDLKASVVADLDAVRARTSALSRKRDRTIEEEAAMVHIATRIASRLVEDQHAALVPDVETPFVDGVDVVKRLLPYHIFQHPKEDLDTVLQTGSVHPSRKGKRKATEEDLLREEIADTKFALECWKRRRDLERRLRKARIQSGRRASPDDQGYFLAQAVLEIERADTAALQQELRAARQELDKIEREKRLAAPPPPATPSTASASRPTMNVRTANYYNPSAPSTPTQTPTTATFMPPYRPYTYSYSQYPTTQYTYNPHAYNATPYATTTSNTYGSTPTTTTPAATPTTYTPTATAATTTATLAASAQVQQAQAYPYAASNTAIPVQLPVSSLNALSALGIVPVAAASVPSAGQPQPPAVIKSTNGSVLNLEINLSLLQSAQMSGLALILNALTSRGVNVDGSSAGTGAVASTVGATVGSAATNDTGVSASTGVSAPTGQPTNGAPSSATSMNGAAPSSSALAPPNTTGAASTTSSPSAALGVPDSTTSTTESKVTAPPSA